MRVAFLSHLDLNLYLFRLPIMKELVRRGYEVYAVCPKGEAFDKFGKFGIKALEYKIDRKSLNIFKEIKTIKNIKRAVSQIKPDILHTFMHKPNIYGNLTKHPNRINTVTGLGSFFIHKDIRSRIVKYAIEQMYKITTKTTKKIVFQNSDDLEFFVDRNIVDKEKAILIKSSGIDTNIFKPMPKNKELLKKLNLDDKPVVLMIARVIKDKGVQEFINAADILKDKANFVYVGDIDKGNKNAFVPDWKNVQYLGFRSDIKELISICDIFVLPSYREGVPRTLLEAGAMGKAIVTTDAVGCREVVDDGVNGFLIPVKNSKALADKIKVLIDNKQLREKYGISIREKIVKEFDVKVVVEQYLKLYEKIISNDGLK